MLCLSLLTVAFTMAGAHHIIDDAAGVLDDILNRPAGALTEVADSLPGATTHRFEG